MADVTDQTVEAPPLASRNGRTARAISPPSAETAVTSILVRALAERSLVWFVLLSVTALCGYAVVATPLWWKLVGVAIYSVLIVMPVLRLAWRQ